MSLENLSISYKCHSSIGNSLKLEEMMEEVTQTFLQESNALYGACYLNCKSTEQIVSIGKQINYDINCLLCQLKETSVINTYKHTDKINLLLFKLENCFMLFFYDSEIDLDFIVPIFESLKTKLTISIASCLNVKRLENKNEELKKEKEKYQRLNIYLQKEIDLAVSKNKEKEKQIFEHLKMAQIGELIGNIAHQWRQPLSIISTASSGMRLKKEMNILTDEDLMSYTQSITNHTEYLSKTIDEFRDYVKESHREKEIVLQNRVKMALEMVSSSYCLEDIKIIEGDMEEEPIYFKLVLGELLQVLISILNNAKEALVNNKIENRWIKYSVIKKEYTAVISIEDSAGGISDEIKNKIFNPYFTTKHQTQGTGIGLYTGYDIVVNHLGGKLSVENTENGAKFLIELPLYKSYSI